MLFDDAQKVSGPITGSYTIVADSLRPYKSDIFMAIV